MGSVRKAFSDCKPPKQAKLDADASMSQWIQYLAEEHQPFWWWSEARLFMFSGIHDLGDNWQLKMLLPDLADYKPISLITSQYGSDVESMIRDAYLYFHGAEAEERRAAAAVAVRRMCRKEQADRNLVLDNLVDLPEDEPSSNFAMYRRFASFKKYLSHGVRTQQITVPHGESEQIVRFEKVYHVKRCSCGGVGFEQLIVKNTFLDIDGSLEEPISRKRAHSAPAILAAHRIPRLVPGQDEDEKNFQRRLRLA
eukprot:12414644-Karenia_brevis.AAC.1